MKTTATECFIAAIVVLAGTCIVQGAPVVVDPEGFPAGTDISSAFPGVTLSAIGSTPLTSGVLSLELSIPASGTRTFGHDGYYVTFWGLVADVLDASLRADFASPVSYVAVDFVPDDSYDPAILLAFDSQGVQIATATTPGTSGFGTVETAEITRPSPDIAYVIASGQSDVDIYIDRMVFDLGAHAGDANGDLLVNVQDLSILATNWNETGSPPWDHGNFNGDDVINVQDLSILATNWGWDGTGGAVPEPATLAVLGLGGLAVWRRRR